MDSVDEPAGGHDPVRVRGAIDAPLEKKKDSLKRFADIYIHSGWQD